MKMRVKTGGSDAALRAPLQGRRRRGAERCASCVAAAGVLLTMLIGMGSAPAGAAPAESLRASRTQTTVWNGSGVEGVGGGAPTLDHEVCGIENGAPVDGAYLQWVLTAKNAGSAMLTIGADEPVAMTRQGKKGTFQYVQSGFASLQAVIDGGVSASSVGKAEPGAKLVLGKGCLAGTPTLTLVSSVPFGMISLGLTEAECLTATASATVQVQYQASGDGVAPSVCMATQDSPPAGTATVAMLVNPAVSFIGPDSLGLNVAVELPAGGTFAPNPACRAFVGTYFYCMVTASTTVTVQAP